MKSINWIGLLGVAALSGISTAYAGSIGIGSSNSVLTFASPFITLGGCVSNVCTIAGTGSIQGAPLQWSIVTTLGSTSISESGAGPNYSIGQNGASIVFTLMDTPLTDSLSGTFALSSALNSFSPDLTDITGVLTYTNVNLTNAALKAYFIANLGALPTQGGTARLDLTISCGASIPCIQPNDPTGTVVSASILPNTGSTTPEPGTLVLLGGGLLALAFQRRLRRI